MAWWTEHVVPRMVDLFLDNDDVRLLRTQVCAPLHGEVVEVGSGSGLNTSHYPTMVSTVAAVEPSDVAWQMAQSRIAQTSVPVRVGLDGQRLDLPDASVDTALSTFTMCTIPDLDRAIAELARVLRPGGRLHFLEHGRSDEPRVVRWQDRVAPVNRRLCGGCRLNRPIDDHVKRSDLTLDHVETFYGNGPKPFGFLYLGVATKPTTSTNIF